ncbi:MAG: hypothetical protein U5K69_00485 [Balneolaceae bacterium]|nr:hypothetical protein [Balneolaceae bacterium]
MSSEQHKSGFNLGSIDEETHVHVNVEQQLIVITEDKLRNHLNKNIPEITGKTGWIPALTLVIAFLIPLLTSDFNNWVFEPIVWEVLVVIGLILSFCRFLYIIYKNHNSKTVEDLIEIIKNKPK